MYIELLIQSQAENGWCAIGSLAESSPKRSIFWIFKRWGHCVDGWPAPQCTEFSLSKEVGYNNNDSAMQ